ncbi:MAG: hypothetical protein M0006_11905 [Magnetospirillum sp.]|nr:hypothetical protein [Magnetospirillum sp.]
MAEFPSAAPPVPGAGSVSAAQMREVVGLFADPHAMETGIQELLTAGFDHGDIAILADQRTVTDTLGCRLADSATAADDPRVPRRGWIEPESRIEGWSALATALGYAGAVTAIALTFASGGGAVAAIGGAVFAAGAGGGLGAALGRLFDRRLARQFEEQMAKGGILAWVRSRSEDDDSRAVEILRRHGAHHVHVRGGQGAGNSR